MSIILEGSDCVGKTTVAQVLASATEMEVVGASRKPVDYDHFGDRISELRPDGVIHDRFHLSGFVYGYLLDLHPENFTPHRLVALVRWIRFSEVPVVILYDSDKKAYVKRMKEEAREEMFDLGIRIAANDCFRMLSKATIGSVAVCDHSYDVAGGWPDVWEVQRWLSI